MQGQRNWRGSCVKKLPCEFCELLTPEQVIQLATPTYKLRKEKQKERDSLVDPSLVTVLSPVDDDKSSWGASSSHNTPEDFSLPQPSFKKELQDLDEKWSLRMAHLEALLTLGQRSSSQVAFSPVKVRFNMNLQPVHSHKLLSSCLQFLLAKPARLLAQMELALLLLLLQLT